MASWLAASKGERCATRRQREGASAGFSSDAIHLTLKLEPDINEIAHICLHVRIGRHRENSALSEGEHHGEIAAQ